MSRRAAYVATTPAAIALCLVLIVACTGAPGAPAPTDTPAASPAAEETPSPSPAATPTAAATETPAATSAATPTPASYPDDDPYEPGGGGTATPAGGTEATVSISHSAEHMEYLVGPEGLALYTFTQDSPGVSNCDGDCLAAWPPLTLAMGEMPTAGAGVTGTLATIVRDDGTYQVTYNDAPLYYFSGDSAAGQTNGHEVGGVWFLATP